MAGATATPEDQGGGKNKLSYSESLKTNVRYDQRLKRNVLEISLEKTSKTSDLNLDNEEISRVLQTLRIDMVSQVQGFQIQHKGPTSVISVWMNQGIDLEKFCKDVNIRVNEGVITGVIRPAGKRSVKVTISGLNFNTPDTFVFDYLNKFGTVVNKSVVYSKYESGSAKGKYNGERKYEVDFSGSTFSMGTYHIIDGSKVRVFYRGNRKTCGRCHKPSGDCPGEAIAKECEAKGGKRIHLSDHMKGLWNAIGFIPTDFEISHSEEEQEQTETVEKVNTSPSVVITDEFPPLPRVEPSPRDLEQATGLSVRNLSPTLSNEELAQFLIKHGLPGDHEHEITVNRNKKNITVVIEDISVGIVQELYKSLHFHESKQKYFDRQLFCKTIRQMSPIKKDNNSNGNKTEEIRDKVQTSENISLAKMRFGKAHAKPQDDPSADFDFSSSETINSTSTPKNSKFSIINLSKKRVISPEEMKKLSRQRCDDRSIERQ